MKINKFTLVILTTDTPHHSYYIKKISKVFSNFLIICENNNIKANYPTKHLIERKTLEYEKKKFFKNKNFSLSNYYKKSFYKVKNINSFKTFNIIDKLKNKLIICFGTRKLNEKFIKKYKNLYNLHGGDTKKYRGLDSHMWAIFFKDMNSLKVTLHKLEKKLDTGKIYKQKNINLKNINNIFQLRHYNTEICVDLTIRLLNDFKKNKIKLKKNKLGKYYSFMPKLNKDKVLKNFRNFKLNAEKF